MPEEIPPKEHILERIADELIALIIIVFFVAVSSLLAVFQKIDELKTFAAVLGPPAMTIVGYYFGRRTMERGIEIVKGE